jgi:hypothetical protein
MLASLPVEAAQILPPERPASLGTKDKVASVASKDAETTGSIQAGASDTSSCDRSRKRLFVEGEGWIVRKVTTCY